MLKARVVRARARGVEGRGIEVLGRASLDALFLGFFCQCVGLCCIFEQCPRNPYRGALLQVGAR